MEQLFRFKPKNERTLNIAVKAFNKRIDELQAKEVKDYLPSKVNFRELKNSIKTESQFRQVVKDLQNFRKEGQSELYITDAGERITEWEKKIVNRNIKQARRRISQRIEELETPEEGSNYSRAQMGSIEYRTLKARQKNLEGFEDKKGYDFKRLKERAYFSGALDYEMKKAIVYEENYRSVLRRYTGLQGYRFLMNRLNKIINPLEFYELMKNAGELAVDLTYQSTENFTQQEFDNFLLSLFGEKFIKYKEKRDFSITKSQKYYVEILSKHD